MWIKELTSCQTFQIFLLLEQIKQYSNSRNGVFQVIFIRNWQGAVTFQFRKKRPKELLDELILNFIWWVPNLKWSCKIQQYFFKDKLNQTVYFLPNCSDILVIATNKRVCQQQKCGISGNFHQELARSCNFPIKKQRSKRGSAWTNF